MPFLKDFAKGAAPDHQRGPEAQAAGAGRRVPLHHRLPGPVTPAADEVYQQFVMVDALAQFCTDKMDLEQTVKWGEEKIKAIYAKFV